MKYPLTLLLLTLSIMFPAHAVSSNPPSKKQTYHVDTKKKLNYKQKKELTKSIKQKKCSKAIDKKTKKVYYICEK